MLEVGIKAPDFELPDQNGKIHRLSDYTGFLSDTLSLPKKEQLFLESVRILYPLIRDLRKNMDWHLHF